MAHRDHFRSSEQLNDIWKAASQDANAKLFRSKVRALIAAATPGRELSLSDDDVDLIVVFLTTWKTGDPTTLPLSSGEEKILIEDKHFGMVNFEISEDDAERLRLFADEATSSACETLRDGLRQQWDIEQREQARDERSFRKTSRSIWGDAIDILRLLLTFLKETHYEIYEGEQPTSPAADVSSRLTARACQITNEIIILLENGFADGAMARWRTLFEILVVAILIDRHGDEIAQRYIEHEAVEAYRIASELRKVHGSLDAFAISDDDFAEAKRNYDSVIATYGAIFGRDYGWAAGFIPKANSFADLLEAADHQVVVPDYRLASHNVHAGAKGITNKLSSISGDGVPWGSSHAGIEEPGLKTVLTVSVISSLLFRPSADGNWSFAAIVKLKLLRKLQEEAVEAFNFSAERLQSIYQDLSGG